MPLSIKLPDNVELPSVVPTLRVRPVKWDADSVGALAHQLGIDAHIEDAGLWFMARSDRAALEIFQATNSFRFSRQDIDGEARDGIEGAIAAEKAIDIASEWLKPYPASEMSLHSVTEREVLVSTRDIAEPQRLVVGVDVSFRYSVHGLPLLGSGAKAKVGVNREGVVIDGYRFWRDFDIVGQAQLLGVDAIAHRFSESELFVDLTDDTAKAEVTSATFGFICPPPTELTASLVPVVELRGTLSTEQRDGYEFIRHIYADAKQDRLKRAKANATLMTVGG